MTLFQLPTVWSPVIFPYQLTAFVVLTPPLQQWVDDLCGMNLKIQREFEQSGGMAGL
jgi:hypothetical protein